MKTVSPVAASANTVVTPPTTAASDAYLVKLAARPDMRTIERMPRGAERKAAAWQALSNTAAQTQAPVVEFLDQLKASGAVEGYETLVSPNMVIVDPAANKSSWVLSQLQSLQGVKSIYRASGTLTSTTATSSDAEEPAFGLDVHSRGTALREAPVEAPYGLGMVGAPEAWKAGATGKGLVYGSIDTGADFTHEALRDAYRGSNPDGTASHDYNWFDFGPRRSATPTDPDAHGTHTIGTVAGRVGESTIGVAPEAKWISARGLVGSADVRLKALQFMQAPTKLDGTAPDPTKAPDVVGMSWWTGPAHEDLFAESIQNLLSAGIEVVKSAGNKGPGPETISSPGQYPTIHAVAAVDSGGQIAEFSSRGPSPLPHTGSSPLWKPDFAAPGVDVLSSIPGNRYAKYSGTSMAQPHFSGVTLALLSKYPQLTHDQLIKVLAATATDSGARGRDLEFGHGVVNIPRALAAAETLVGGPKAEPAA
jgi:subtilisin family serine protease